MEQIYRQKVIELTKTLQDIELHINILSDDIDYEWIQDFMDDMSVEIGIYEGLIKAIK